MSKHGHYQRLNSFIAKIFSIFPNSLLRVIYNLNRNTNGFIGLGIRYVCIKNLAKSCGNNVAIFPNTIIKHFDNLEIGNNVSIHPYCYIDAIGGIEINDNVSIANHCSIISFGHTWNDIFTPIKYNPLIMTPIKINSDVWIGCGVRIIGPCEIHSRTVIAAGAVARGELLGNNIYGGIPSKKIKELKSISINQNLHPSNDITSTRISVAARTGGGVTNS